MKRVLFVDDEARVLDGLRRMLHRQRRAWDMRFVDSGEAALAELEREPCDVLVTDMRMPRMDGNALLRIVAERWPEVVRIVLSGHTELETAMRAVPLAHQFITKPCEPEGLRATIERTCAVRSLLQSERLLRVVGNVKSLPSPPRLYSELTRVLEAPDCSFREIAQVVEQDMGLAAKVLQLVNSSFFGLSRSVATVEAALRALGTNMVKNLCLSDAVLRPWDSERVPESVWRQLQRHSLLTAGLARLLLSGSKKDSEEAFAAGLLHDIGKLVLATEMPEAFEAVVEGAQAGRTMAEVEEEILGVTHAEVGACLLGIWGLPYSVVEAVAHHHHPSRVSTDCFDVVGAVHVADLLVHQQSSAAEPGGNTHEGLDTAWSERVGMTDRLGEWSRLAAEHLKEAKELLDD